MKERFDAELIEGHKGVVVALVPFNPEEAFKQAPVRLAGRRHGWLVKGTANGEPFDGYIGERWGRFFIIVDDQARAGFNAGVGVQVSFVVGATRASGVWAKALEQSKRTTQPAKARADAVVRPT